MFIHAKNDYSLAPGEVITAEMAKLGKPHQLKIYPPVGRSPRDGHNLMLFTVPTWERDVFAFLDPLMQR